ncbi:MAG TPA: hypothetical protein VFC82_05775 [Actinomycetaceae bacterium]|nr:hypothetical protein [Actinomycetaceae bacterium]
MNADAFKWLDRGMPAEFDAPPGSAATVGAATVGLEVVAGTPDETELAALFAVGAAVQSASAAAQAVADSAVGADSSKPTVNGEPRCGEWTNRGRRGAVRGSGARVPGTMSNDWRWSLRG